MFNFEFYRVQGVILAEVLIGPQVGTFLWVLARPFVIIFWATIVEPAPFRQTKQEKACQKKTYIIAFIELEPPNIRP